MRKMTYLVLVLSLWPLISQGQTPKRIHDLKSLTDSSGTVHLFYRIYAEYEGTDYFTDNIYHYNSETGEEKLFLEDYYDDHLGYEYQSFVNEYHFYENEPEKYILRGSFGFEFGYIERSDSVVFEGFAIFVEKIKLSKNFSSTIYAKFSPGGYLKSMDGGITWPDESEIREDNIADSLVLDFPLVSISPYDENLMFGASEYFFQSPDAGATYDTVEVYPNNEEIFYDKDGKHVYAMNSEDCSSDSGCKYYLYKSVRKGESGSWEKPIVFDSFKQISVHPSESGMLFIWGKDSIFVSEGYGESVDFLYEMDEEITGVVVEGEQVFITTISSLYELKNDELILLRQIPVRNEETYSEIPSEIILYQNYPNPFNPSTVIRFELTKTTQVSLNIYDVSGRLVQALVSKKSHPAGEYGYTWNADTNISSGVYFYRLVAGQEVQTKRMILIK